MSFLSNLFKKPAPQPVFTNRVSQATIDAANARNNPAPKPGVVATLTPSKPNVVATLTPSKPKTIATLTPPAPQAIGSLSTSNPALQGSNLQLQGTGTPNYQLNPGVYDANGVLLGDAATYNYNGVTNPGGAGPNIFGASSLSGSGLGSSSGASSSSGTTSAPANLVEYPPGSGIFYNLSDDTQRANFYNAKLTDMTHARDQQLAAVQGNINQLGTSAQNYVTNYFKQLQNLGDVKGQGDLNRINAYSAASPNAFQSSEGDSYNSANQKYLQGLGDAARQANADVGASFLANPTNLASLGANTTYGRQYNNYETGINQIGTDYNQQLQGINQQNNPSTNPFASSYQAAGLQVPNAVDLSAYSPFVGFNKVQTGPLPNAQNPGAIQGTPFPTSSLSNFLGKTNLNPNDTTFLQNYLSGATS